MVQILNMPEDQLRFDLALGLFVDNKVSLGQASKIARMGGIQFQRELAARKIPLHYGIEEFREDLRTIESLSSP